MRRSRSGCGAAAAMASLSDTWQNLVSRNYSSHVHLSTRNELYLLIWRIDARWLGVIFFRSVAFTSNRISYSMSIHVCFWNKFRPSAPLGSNRARTSIMIRKKREQTTNEDAYCVESELESRSCTCPVPLLPPSLGRRTPRRKCTLLFCSPINRFRALSSNLRE